jgi:hypothetical protein
MASFFVNELASIMKNDFNNHLSSAESDFVHKNKLFDLIIYASKKNEIQSIHDREDLLSQCLNVFIYILRKFINDYGKKEVNYDENHILNRNNKTWFRNKIIGALKNIENDMGAAFDHNKKQIEQPEKKDETEEAKKDIERKHNII